jgi:hypothetical protein
MDIDGVLVPEKFLFVFFLFISVSSFLRISALLSLFFSPLSSRSVSGSSLEVDFCTGFLIER